MTIGKRLETFVAISGKSRKAFSQLAKIPYRTLQDYLADKRKPGADHLVRLAESGIDVHWLLTGQIKSPSIPLAELEQEETQQAELLWADVSFSLHLKEKASERTDQFHARYLKQHGETLPFDTLLRVYGEYFLMMVRVSAKIAPHLLELRTKGVENHQLIDDVVDAAVGEYLDKKVAGRLKLSLD